MAARSGLLLGRVWSHHGTQQQTVPDGLVISAVNPSGGVMAQGALGLVLPGSKCLLIVIL